MKKEVEEIKNKKVIIKTFLFESGLWYLAKSLGDALIRGGNDVLYVSKAKYVESGDFPGRFKRIYPPPNDVNLLNDVKSVVLSAGKKVDKQIVDAIKSFDADILISFETLMHTAQWVRLVKTKTRAKVIDVPMPEWVSNNYLKNMSYNIFDEVWCLTDTAEDVFEDYSNAQRASWDFVDAKAFDGSGRTNGFPIKFYHPGTTNKDCSNKNTTEVIKAFIKFSGKVEDPVVLTITGKLTDKQLKLANSNENILIIEEFLEKQNIIGYYNDSHCILSPSTKEGLGLSFYEAAAAGCGIITTDIDPMNQHTEYLCKVVAYNKDESPVPAAITGSSEIFDQLMKFYGDFKMSNKANVKDREIKKKTKKQSTVDAENESLMAAFSEGGAGEALEEIQGDNSEILAADEGSSGMDEDVLVKLRGKMSKKKGEEPMPSVVSKKSVSIELAVIGVGQAGSRIAEVMHKNGYDVGVINTSSQDLEFIDVLPTQKLLLEGSLGGTGKDLDLGREIFEDSQEALLPFVSRVVEGNHMVYLAVSGGGGTGSSSVDVLVTMLFETGLPVGVIFVLPKATEDAQSKRNSIETLSRLAKMTADNMVASLVVVDNARIEQIYANLSQAKFWEASNKAIVEPLHVFNTLTAKASRHTSMDPSDFGKIISCGDCSIYGLIEVDDYMEETALAEAVIESLDSNMLASGFDLEQTRYGGVIIAANEDVLAKLPSININYCFHMISEKTSGASIYQGVYGVETDTDSVKIYSWFAGMGLPRDRIENLKQESKLQAQVALQKEKSRAAAMTLDLNENKVNNVTDEVHRKIQKKKSGFSRLQRGSIIDKRRKR